ncbi:MAG: hypothetical protein NDI68_06300 [Arenimonas sp.]|nr:hypothetical protein [Arenimonas sp.]
MDGAANPTAPQDERQPPDEGTKALVRQWHKRIEAALKRVPAEKFKKHRTLLAGKSPDGTETVRANLHFANLAAMLPQIYAKDPEFAAQPTRAVDPEQIEAAKKFASTVEFMLHKVVVKDAGLKKQIKRQVRSTFPTSVGWIKASYQEDRRKDPLIVNRLKDTQDNIANIERLLAECEDEQVGRDHEQKLAELRQAMAGLEVQQEIVVAKGIAVDFVMAEDVVVLDASVLAVTDYQRADALALRVWMTEEKYRTTFGYKPSQKATRYGQQQGTGAMQQNAENACLVCVWEIWDQQANRVHYVCDGEEDFCKESSSPDWCGERWYPFFLIAFNEIDGSFYPLSDIELTEKLVKEYNEAREDFARDRRECLPLTVARKGGSLTDDDLQRIKNRKGSDIILVEGNGGSNPLSNDLFSGQLGQIRQENYDTTQSRYDIERILGGSDATTGSLTKASTATEAEILSQGLRSRTAERQDILEDMLNELGKFCLEILLRKFGEAEVKRMAGPEAVWPRLSMDQVFDLVNVEVRSGSTGKPDRLQEQDRWSKLLPIINEAVAKVAELRAQGQEALAQAVIEITRETLRRFDERIDIEQFLPKKPEGEDDPALLKQQLVSAQGQMQTLMEQLAQLQDKVEKGYVAAAAAIATSANPALGAMAFRSVLGEIAPEAVPPGAPEPDPLAGGPAQQPPMAIQ